MPEGDPVDETNSVGPMVVVFPQFCDSGIILVAQPGEDEVPEGTCSVGPIGGPVIQYDCR